MKRIYIIVILCLGGFSALKAQNKIEDVLLLIEKNNPILKANAHSNRAKVYENKASNNLSDPSISYNHLWNEADKHQTSNELAIEQNFKFPLLYIKRHQLNGLKSQQLDQQQLVLREKILVKAKTCCLDIIMLHQLNELLNERYKNAKTLNGIYQKRFSLGDANIIETNKIELELLNVETQLALNKRTLANKLETLKRLNGNKTIEFNQTVYTSVELPVNYESLKSEVVNNDKEVALYQQETKVAQKEITLNKMNWLPNIKIGYKRNVDNVNQFNGIITGLSIPLFSNKNRVKQAKAKALSLIYQKENYLNQINEELFKNYEDAKVINQSIKAYEETLKKQQGLSLLKEALLGGEISLIEYFSEVSTIFQSIENYISLKNQYHKTMTLIYKYNL